VPEVDDAQRQERRKKAGDLLKMADKLFKGSDFEGAERLVQMAMETDPQNAYALAYQERVKYAIAQRDAQRQDTAKAGKPGPPESPAAGDGTKTAAAPRPSPEEIKKKLEQAQKKIVQERARTETAGQAVEKPSAPDTAVAEKPETTELRKELEVALQNHAALQTQLTEVQGVLDSERAQWNAERDRLPGEWEHRLQEERQVLEQKRVESEAHLESVAKTLRAQLEEGIHARATLQQQVHEMQAQLDHSRSASQDELTTARNVLEDQLQDLRQGLEQTRENALQERQQWETERAREIESTVAGWQQRLAEEHRLVQEGEDAAQRMNGEIAALRNAIEEITLGRDAAMRKAEELEEKLAEAQRVLEEERKSWIEERDGERAATETQWSQRLAEEAGLREMVETDLRGQLTAMTEKYDTLLERLDGLQQQHEEVVARFAEESLRWETDRESLQQGMHEEEERKLADERRRFEELHAQRVEADLDAWETRLKEERLQWENEHKEAGRALQARHIAEMSAVKEQLQSAAQLRTQEESQALQDLRRKLEQEAGQRLEAASAKFQEERQRMELEMQSRLAAESHRQEDLRRERDELVTQLDGLRATSETERRRIEEELQNPILTEHASAADEVRERLEARRDIEEQLRKEFEATLMSRLKEERERIQQEYQDRMEGERTRVESELRAAFDAEAQRRSDEEARLAREDRKAHEAEEQERRKEEEARKYEEAVRQAIEEGRHRAHLRKIASHIEQAQTLLTKARFAQALEEVSRVFALDPSHEEALALEHTIRSAQVAHERRKENVHKLQEEQRRRLEEVQKRQKEQEQKERVLQKERAAREETAVQRIARAAEYRRLGALDRSLNEVQAVLAMDPGNSEAQDMEISILTQLKGHIEVRAAVARRTEQEESSSLEEVPRELEDSVSRDHLREESTQVYRNMLRRAWMQGVPGRDTRAMLDVARVSLGINENEHTILESQVQLESYREALDMALKASLLDIGDADAMDGLRSRFDVEAQAHEAILQSLQRRSS